MRRAIACAADGKGRLRIEITTLGGQFLQFTQIAEMIREQWKKIGIDLNVQEVERSLAIKRAAANEQQLGAWNNDGSEHLFTFPVHVFPFNIENVATSGPLYAKWFQSAGAQGKEPPPRLRELMEKFRQAFGVPEAGTSANWARRSGRSPPRRSTSSASSAWARHLWVCASPRTIWGISPPRQYNSPDGKTPAISRPVTFYFKN